MQEMIREFWKWFEKKLSKNAQTFGTNFKDSFNSFYEMSRL